TLEEPPKHVIFILATTEKHKIIPTILSRCQIFDFNRISIHHITERLQFVADSEHITADPDALSIIAQKADGAMRDALSIFDQIVSFSGNNITYNTTIENLNVLNYDYYFRITTALLNGNYPEALSVFSEVIEEGFDGGIFVSGLASHFRDLLMCKDPGTVKLLEVGVNIQKRYHEVSSECPVDFLFSAIELANEADYKYKNVRNKRLLVEICLLKISQAGSPTFVKTERPQVVAAEPAKQ
ncbi:MAG TPA: DNA polymerase III subunit gamma/tau, partial [Bacteroidales bacterium]|nr:DNA polymerase III subunit gamma/tau [Bacteroidales bacterium]